MRVLVGILIVLVGAAFAGPDFLRIGDTTKGPVQRIVEGRSCWTYNTGAGDAHMMRFSPQDLIFLYQDEPYAASVCAAPYRVDQYRIVTWSDFFPDIPFYRIPYKWTCSRFMDPVTCYFGGPDNHTRECVSDFDGSRPFGFWTVVCKSTDDYTIAGPYVISGTCRLFYILKDEYEQIKNGTLFPEPPPPPPPPPPVDPPPVEPPVITPPEEPVANNDSWPTTGITISYLIFSLTWVCCGAVALALMLVCTVSCAKYIH